MQYLLYSNYNHFYYNSNNIFITLFFFCLFFFFFLYKIFHNCNNIENETDNSAIEGIFLID